nr:hypothetical protein [uncultured Tateyamaria sp.]
MSFLGWFVGASEFSDDVIHDTSLGNGLILAGAGNNVVYGNAGDDHLRGESGNDTLYDGDGTTESLVVKAMMRFTAATATTGLMVAAPTLAAGTASMGAKAATFM